MKKRIAIFASGNGTNAENIIRTFRSGNRVEVTCVVCNKRSAGAMLRAASLNIPTIYISNQELAEAPQELIQELKNQQVDLIVLAGFMRRIPDALLEAFPDRIINIHPSLLPAYGGKGMYGHHVHEAVIAAREPQSGVTVHYVNSVMDGGRILMQEVVDLMPGETPDSLESKIHNLEYSMYPRAIVAALEEITAREEALAREAAATQGEQMDEAAVTPGAVPPPMHQTPPPMNVDQEWAKVLHINYEQPTPVPPMPHSVPPAMPTQQVHHPIPQTIPQPMAQPMAQPQPVAEVVVEQAEVVAKPPRNYLVFAILCTVLCFLPFGIIAIVYSAQVNSKFYKGDIEGSKKMSERAQLWIILAFVFGIVWQSLYTPLSMIFNLFTIV